MAPFRCLAAWGVAALAGVAAPAAGDGFVTIHSLSALREYAARDHVRVRLQPGDYLLDRADGPHFLVFTGRGSHYDLRGVRVRIDTRLFRAFGQPAGPEPFYCAFDLRGDDLVFEGVTTENVGDLPGIQSRNKIFNVVGARVVLRDVEITTAGSQPWGCGSLFGISGGDVRKMNGIRVGWPATGVRLEHCRVHMRAMGHGIFVQGAADTVIERCTVDGRLRPTDDLLAEPDGYAAAHHFRTAGHGYVEGVRVGDDGAILPGEMLALSEDGIRLYDQGGGHPTGPTLVRGCTVERMRRGICTGLGPAADRVEDCTVRECVAAGFNVGSGDRLERCRADAKYAEALSCPSPQSRGVVADLDILDSRGGCANELLATLNGHDHRIALHTAAPAFVPAGFVIATATHRGYAFYQRGPVETRGLELHNATPAAVVCDEPAPAHPVAP